MPNAAPSVQRELFVRRLASMEMAGVDPPESFVNQLLVAARDVYFGPREVMFEEGGASDWIYMLRDGLVELKREGEKPWRFVNGAVGILDAMIGRPHQRTAIAVEPTSCLAVHRDDYFAMLEDHVDFSHDVVRFQASRLHAIHRDLPDKEARFSRPASWRLIRSDAKTLGVVERLIVIRQATAFAGSSIQPLVSLAERARSEVIPEGGVVFREGDKSNRIWIVADGRISIEANGKQEAIRGPGELIESFAAFGHAARLYTATAVKRSMMVTLDEDDMFDRMEEHFELTRAVLSYMARKWEQINLSLAARTGTFKGAGGG